MWEHRLHNDSSELIFVERNGGLIGGQGHGHFRQTVVPGVRVYNIYIYTYNINLYAGSAHLQLYTNVYIYICVYMYTCLDITAYSNIQLPTSIHSSLHRNPKPEPTIYVSIYL